jgi:endonuclease/exonuclease/phosphatase family metal-dependent hydrolase/2'-5' RNA ligase
MATVACPCEFTVGHSRPISNRTHAKITVLFPCGAAEDLPQFANSLRETLSRPEFQPFHIKLDRVGRFATRDYETVHLGSSNSSRSEAIWRAVSEPAENTHNCKRTTYVPHMTLGQTTRRTDSVAFLTGKAARLIEGHDLRWLVDSVVLLQKNTERGGAMEVYAQIPIGARTALVPKALPSLATPSYHFDGSHWTPRTPPASPARASFTAATYNILHDPAFPFPSRLTAVINALLECDADLVCLQEVTDDALALITADAQIRARWPWCSRGASAVLESERNVVLLAKEDSAFEWTRVELGGKHKACIVARLCFQLQHSTTNKSVVVVGVHLSAGRTPPARQKRQEELTKLLAYLREHHHSDEWLVIGDSNSQVDESHIDFNATLLDCWAETVGGDGATYDPTKNLLASATARNNQTAERYDRVFVREEGWLEIKSEGLSLFGIPEQGRDVGSDHWGLRAVVDIRDEGQAKGSTTSALARIPDHPALPPAGTVLTDLELHNLCVENGCIPTEAHNIAYQNALDTLRGFLDDLCSRSQPISQPSADSNPSTSTSAPSAVRLVLAPVGSFAMGYHTPDSDIDCVVVGNVNPNTFWGLIRSRIRAAGGQGPVKLRRFVKDALVQMMELQVDLVKVDLQYCPAANLIEW